LFVVRVFGWLVLLARIPGMTGIAGFAAKQPSRSRSRAVTAGSVRRDRRAERGRLELSF
jgi:hypothetical protein